MTAAVRRPHERQRPVRRALVGASAAVATASALLVAAPTAQADSPPGGVVLPLATTPSTDVRIVGASAEGVLAYDETSDTYWSRTPTSEWERRDIGAWWETTDRHETVGRYAMAWEMSDGTSGNVFIRALDLVTGDVEQTDVDGTGFESVRVVNTGDGFVATVRQPGATQAENDLLFVRGTWGGSTQTWTEADVNLQALIAADDAGVLFSVLGASGWGVFYRSYAAGPAEPLAVNDSVAYANGTTGQPLGLVDDDYFSWWGSSGPGADVRLVVTRRFGDFGRLTYLAGPSTIQPGTVCRVGDLFAYTLGFNAPFSSFTIAEAEFEQPTPDVDPIDTTTAQRSPVQCGDVGDGPQLLGAGSGARPGGWAFDDAAGSATPTAWDPPLPRALKTAAVAFDDDQLLTSTATAAGADPARLDAYAVAGTHGGTLDVPGPPTQVLSSVPASTSSSHMFALSGSRRVVNDNTVTPARVRMYDNGAQVWSLERSNGAYQNLALSGPYVLVGGTVRSSTNGSPQFTIPTPFATATVASHRAIWSKPDGEVVAKDLTTDAAPYVVRAGDASLPCSTCGRRISAWGDYVASGQPGANELSINDLRDPSLVLQGPNWFGTAPDANFWVGDDVLLVTYEGSSGAGVMQYDLSNAIAGTVTGLPFLDEPVVDGQLDGRTFAYTTAAGQVGVAPVSVGTGTAPRWLGYSGGGSISPNDDGVADEWQASVDFTRPVEDCTFRIRDESDTVVFQDSLSVSGSRCISALWIPSAANGPGVYTWELEAYAPGDVEPALGDGDALPGGSFRLRTSSSQTATVKAPANVAKATASARTPLTLTAGTLPSYVSTSGFDVDRRTVTISKRGQQVVGPVRALLRDEPSTAPTYKAAKGSTNQFRVRAVDSTGLRGPWSGWVTSHTPIDDRGLDFGKGWKQGPSADRWAGTSTSTTSEGRRFSYSARTSGFDLVATTGPKAGWVRVFVNGQLRDTVSLKSANAKPRQVVWSARFAKPGTYEIEVVTKTKGQRKKVEIDALVVRH